MSIHLSQATRFHVVGDYLDGKLLIKDIAAKHGLKRPSHVSVIVKRAARPNRYKRHTK